MFVRDLVLEASVGVYDHERVKPQRVRVTLDCEVTGDSEVIGPGLTSEDRAAIIRSIVDQGHIILIETMAEQIAARCLDDPRVRSVTVRVEKLDVFPDVASVGVEIQRSR